jgi:hypothetical protein
LHTLELNNIELVKRITKVAMNKYHGDRFDYAIDQMDLIRRDFNGTPCYYHQSSKATTDGKYIAFNDGQMYILTSFKNTNTININTNLLYSKWFFYKYGRQFSHISDNESDYDIEFNLRTKYNMNLIDVLQEVRDSKIEMIL